MVRQTWPGRSTILQTYLVFQKFVGDGTKIGNLEKLNIFVMWAQFNIIFQALKKILQGSCTPTRVFQQRADPFSLVLASLQLRVLFSLHWNRFKRQVFLLTLSINANVSWVFPKPQPLGYEPTQIGQRRKEGWSLWGCHVWNLWDLRATAQK